MGGRSARKARAADAMYHRGWAMVDVGRSKWAAKDGTNVRLRVCRDTDPFEVAVAAFRAVVDREEGACAG